MISFDKKLLLGEKVSSSFTPDLETEFSHLAVAALWDHRITVSLVKAAEFLPETVVNSISTC